MESAVVEMLKPDEVRALLNISKGTMYGMLRSGELPSYRIGALWRISKGDLETWLKDRQNHGNIPGDH